MWASDKFLQKGWRRRMRSGCTSSNKTKISGPTTSGSTQMSIIDVSVQFSSPSRRLTCERPSRTWYSQATESVQDVILLPGDRVLAKNSQYIIKNGGGKFICKFGKVRDFLVREKQRRNRETPSDTDHGHERYLKLLPKTLRAEGGGTFVRPTKRAKTKHPPP